MVASVLYEIGVPVFCTALQNQILILKKGQQWCELYGQNTSELISAAIPGDVFGLPFHVTFCVNNVCQTLLDLEVLDARFEPPNIINTKDTALDVLIRILEQTVDYLDRALPEAFIGRENKVIKFEAEPVNKKPLAL